MMKTKTSLHGLKTQLNYLILFQHGNHLELNLSFHGRILFIMKMFPPLQHRVSKDVYTIYCTRYLSDPRNSWKSSVHSYAVFRTSFCLGLCLGCDQGPRPFSPGASEFRRYLFLPGLCTIDARICAIVQHITPLEHSTFQLLSFPPIAVRLSPARLLLVAACPAAAQLRSLKPRHRASPVYGTNEEATYRQARCAASPPGWDA